jgi:hypothetical protein
MFERVSVRWACQSQPSTAMPGTPLPIYGDGQQIRDWLYVKDHCSAMHVLRDVCQIDSSAAPTTDSSEMIPMFCMRASPNATPRQPHPSAQWDDGAVDLLRQRRHSSTCPG